MGFYGVLIGPFFEKNPILVTNDWIILKFGMGHLSLRAKGPQASEAKQGLKGPPGGQRPPALHRI